MLVLAYRLLLLCEKLLLERPACKALRGLASLTKLPSYGLEEPASVLNKKTIFR
jgi:hypothetical protein